MCEQMIYGSPSTRRAWIGISLSLLTKCGYRIYKPGPSGAGDGERKSESGHRIHKKSKIADGASWLPHRAGNPLPQAERGTRTKKSGSTHTAARTKVAAHVRRGHYHHFWQGSRKDGTRKLILKWVAPIFVNAGNADNMLPTIHRIK